MFNKVVLVGNLTRNLELRYTNTGSAIGNSAIAVTRKYTGADGSKKEETCFIDITFFGKMAEIANQYLTKGSKLLIEGRLKFDQWQDQNGASRSKHSIVVENMEMLGSAQQPSNTNQNTQQGNYQNSYRPSNYNKPQSNQMDYSSKEDNIPEIDIDNVESNYYGKNNSFNQEEQNTDKKYKTKNTVQSSKDKALPEVDIDNYDSSYDGGDDELPF